MNVNVLRVELRMCYALHSGGMQLHVSDISTYICKYTFAITCIGTRYEVRTYSTKTYRTYSTCLMFAYPYAYEYTYHRM